MTFKSILSGVDKRGIRHSETGVTIVFSRLAAAQHNPPVEARKVKQSKTIVLGAQASPPARVKKDQFYFLEWLKPKFLVRLDTGRRGRLRPRTMVFD